MLDSIITAAVIGVAQGLIIWGGLRADQRALRRDVDRHQEWLSKMDARCFAEHRRPVRGGMPL